MFFCFILTQFYTDKSTEQILFFSFCLINCGSYISLVLCVYSHCHLAVKGRLAEYGQVSTQQQRQHYGLFAPAFTSKSTSRPITFLRVTIMINRCCAVSACCCFVQKIKYPIVNDIKKQSKKHLTCYSYYLSALLSYTSII